ncbi:tetratricopeptide repeat protein [Bacillus sp. 165]|uniref:tetratricopeptide repeat protein n=1 Tax=Bacillus sp. 165 TaxID=1529117 RepID=UPI001ADA27FA|nr:tetratricopeptide repeat protein [Bacillus sp. 165]MBO9129928.1 tetratricopeptide repeat protein [Bacillus sp. 165]
MGKNQSVKKDRGQVISFSESVQFFYEKGMKAYRRHDLKQAIKYLQRAAHSQQEPFILSQLAAALSDAGDYHQSNQILTDIIKLDPEMEECYYFLANNYAYLGLFQQARKYAEHYLEVTEEEEFVEDALELLDMITIEEGDVENEWEGEDELIVMQERANSCIRNGQHQEAVSILETMIAEYPEFWSAYNNLAVAKFQIGKIDEALQLTDDILNKNPGNLHALCNQVVFLYSIGQYKEATILVNALENVHPILFEQRFKLGTMFATVGRYELGYKWLKSLKRQGYEGDVSFYYWLSYSAYMVGETHTAQKMWQHVVELYPDKEGKEPWNYTDFSAVDQHTFLQQLTLSFEEERDDEKKMLALYLINELQTEDKLPVFFDIAEKQEHHSIIVDMGRYFFLKGSNKRIPKELSRLEKCLQIADCLYGHTKKDDALIEDTLTLWFQVVKGLYSSTVSVSNVLGWSAAIEYTVRRRQNVMMTQTEVGKMYSISPATLRKYVQAIAEQGV